MGNGGEERHGRLGGGSSVAGVREGVAGGGEGAASGWRRAAHSPATPSRHLHGSHSCSIRSAGVGGPRLRRTPGIGALQ
jgi:hypothetical protein